MGISANIRGPRTREELPLSDVSPSSHSTSPTLAISSNNNNKKWSNFLPFFIIFVVIVEICFLGRLDMAKNAALVDLADSLFYNRNLGWGSEDWQELTGVEGKDDKNLKLDSCEDWLEKEDSVVYSRDFVKDPVLIDGDEEGWRICAVGCHFGSDDNRKPDGAFGEPNQGGTTSVTRSMESSQYYTENNISYARGMGYNVVMTTSLSSDVPVGYFSWAEYDIMAPVQPKTEKALAAAFISNCAARNFRLQALVALKANVPIDSYGACHKNRYENVDKVQALKRYKFSLAFENSNEEDYVTEKFFQSLVAGAIPVVVGAPNIQDFAPANGSVLHVKELKDVAAVAKSMKYLAENPDAYNRSLRWKYEGPSDSFKALLDMAAVHSSCRLCIHLATMIWEKEERSPGFKKRPCKCTKGSETVYHLYVRERGRFLMESIFLRSGNLTLNALETEVLKKFKSTKHEPVWKTERPESLRRGEDYKVYRIYPVGMTQKEALYTFRFKSDGDFRKHLKTNPCAKFEVIFV